MKGVILAAGKGSRLYPVTHHIPKPILPLANRMTLEYAFDKLKEMGIRDICIVVGENEPEMRKALGAGEAFGVQLAYARQPEPKGLAHAISFAEPWVGSDSFVLYLGDAIYGEGFEAHHRLFEESGCANLNIVKPVPDPQRFGVANVEGNRIIKLVEKPQKPESNLAMAGMYFLTNKIWSVIPDLKPSARGEYEITDAIQMLIDRGETVLAGVYEGTWFDTGTLDSFLQTSSYLINGARLIDDEAEVDATVHENVVVGRHARVKAESLRDCVILPGATVTCTGAIEHSILGGVVSARGDLRGAIAYGSDILTSN